MAHVRLLIGRFLSIDGQVIETFEDQTAGVIIATPARAGQNGCSLFGGGFFQR